MQYPSFVQSSVLYNKLTDVTEADSLLTTVGRARAIECLLTVIRRHGLEKTLCVRLLHKHSAIFHDEIMVEELIYQEDEPTLVTRPAIEGELRCATRPNSWMLSDDGVFIPFEYSDQSLLVESTISPSSAPEVFDELALALTKNSLKGVLAIGLCYNDLIEAKLVSGSKFLVETTSEVSRANVLHFISADQAVSMLARDTKWRADLHSHGVTTVCKCSYTPDGKHLGTHVHFPDDKKVQSLVRYEAHDLGAAGSR